MSESKKKRNSPNNPPNPQIRPDEIIALAKSLGYSERRTSVSYTLFFREDNPAHDMPPVLLNVYYTTRSIMTYLNHPTAGSNELWRSNAYKDLDELKSFLENPRRHSGKGYRNKNKAVRGCVSCGSFKQRNEYSKNQWTKGPDVNRCKACMDDYMNEKNNAANAGGAPKDDYYNHDTEDDIHESSSVISELSDALSGVYIDEYPSLTSDLLNAHNKKIQSSTKNNKREKLERRQFNCPECPKQGRGKHVFFKRVPMYKPVVKCPKCKRVKGGKCNRLYPVPKASEKVRTRTKRSEIPCPSFIVIDLVFSFSLDKYWFYIIEYRDMDSSVAMHARTYGDHPGQSQALDRLATSVKETVRLFTSNHSGWKLLKQKLPRPVVYWVVDHMQAHDV